MKTKTIAIFYFSGTGNTEIVARMLTNEFEKQEYAVDMIRIEDVVRNRREMNTDSYDLIGIGSQVIGFGVPYVVQKFLRHFPQGSKKKVFIFRTAGGVAPINYNASKLIIRVLSKKGYDVFYERIFSISSNWITRFDDAVIRQLHDAAGKKVSIMCREVLSGQKRILKTGHGLKLLMEAIAFIFTRFLRVVGKDMIIDQACTNCGQCIRNCPSSNIYTKNGRIRFRLSCSSCLRCVYACPKNAMSLRLLSFFPVKGGYDIKSILANDCTAGETKNRPEPPFLKAYLENDAL